MNKIECEICKTEVTSEDISNHSAFGGLPSPCCKICFGANDYRIKSLEELAVKSLNKRVELKESI